MNEMTVGADGVFAVGRRVALRRVEPGDLAAIAGFPFTVSITEPLDAPAALAAAHAAGGFWGEAAGAAAIVEAASGRLLGTTQFYRAAPCIHGFELGYILHGADDRGRGFGTEAVGLMSDHVFAAFPAVFRQQLMIETWNVASWRLAERCGFVREGLLRSAGFGAGDRADCFVYGRTRKDWAAGRARPVSLGG
jgi:ribosomal-protein-serine acetyltransferase